MRFALSMMSEAVACLLILRTSARISKTANGLPPAVSAKPLSDCRNERLMVVLLHNPPGLIAEMTGVSGLLDSHRLVVVPFRPTTPQVKSVVRTAPLAASRGRGHIKRNLLLIEFL